MDGRCKPIDEDAFIADAASGRFTVYDLARRTGLSEKQVSRILRGESRPELAGRVRLAEKARGRLHSRLLELGDKAAGTLADAMDGKASATALRAAREVLKYVFVPPTRTGVPLTGEESREYNSRIKWAFDGQPDQPDEPAGAARPEPPKPLEDGRKAESPTAEKADAAAADRQKTPDTGRAGAEKDKKPEEKPAVVKQGSSCEGEAGKSGQKGRAAGPAEKPRPKREPGYPVNTKGDTVWWS